MKSSLSLLLAFGLASSSLGCAVDASDGGIGGTGASSNLEAGETSAPGAGGTGATPGAGGTGNTPGTGGADSTGPSSCAAIDAGDVLSDFESGEAKLAEIGGRKGSWYLSDDGSGTTSPVKVENTPLAAEVGGACESGFAFRTTGTDFTGWGSLAAVDLVPKVSDVKQPYDASAYVGLAFRGKSVGPVQVRVEISTADTMEEGGVCNPAAVSGDPDRCGDHFGTNIVLSGDWADVKVPFAMMAQKGWGLPVSSLDASAAYSVRFKVEGGAFDYTIDDVHLTK